MKKITFILFLAGSILLSSCELLNGLVGQINDIANLRNCQFDLKNVNNISVAGVNLKHITNGNISATDVLKLVAAYQNKSVPLNMDVNINVKNPTEHKAALSALDWILAVDGTDMASGVNTRSHTITPKATTTVPLGVNADLGQLFSKKGVDALKNFASSFSSDGTSSKVGLRIKPRLNVGTKQVSFPNYVKLEMKTGGKS